MGDWAIAAVKIGNAGLGGAVKSCGGVPQTLSLRHVVLDPSSAQAPEQNLFRATVWQVMQRTDHRARKRDTPNIYRRPLSQSYVTTMDEMQAAAFCGTARHGRRAT